METIRDIQRWAYVKLLRTFEFVDAAIAYWEQRFINYLEEVSNEED